MTESRPRFWLPIVLLAACSSPTDDPNAPRDGRDGGTTALPRLVIGSELRGQRVETVAQGPWSVRRMVGDSGDRDAGSAGWSAGRELDERSVRRIADSEHEFAASAPASPPAARADGSAPAGELAREPAPAESVDSAAFPVPDATRPAPDLNPLRAGSTDDNADHAAYVAWLASIAESGRLDGRYERLDVADRRSIRVVDATGAPVPGAAIAVIDEAGDRVAWRATTYGDGRTPFFPKLAAAPGATPAGTCLIEVRVGDRVVRDQWNLAGDEFVVRLPDARPDTSEVMLDVVFLIDTTGSMSDEIDRIKATLQGVTQRLENLDREFSLRYGAVLYRDVSDDYVTMAHPFTSDLTAFADALQQIQAGGGGDTPESLNQGLAVAIGDMEWRQGAAKLVFLIADAPPHLDYEGDVPYGDSARAAVASGIRVHTVAASGLDEAGSVVFRQLAHLTRGRFIFIEYGGDVAASGAAHGVTGGGSSNNLDEILFERIRDEIAGWGRS
ncbi:MAG: VWA domain-containing protein [Planctomycetes bacterium]|nr:VWA domain-containing protein [Planctomycetota bacterium]